MSFLSPDTPYAAIGMRFVLGLKQAFASRHDASARFTIEIVTQNFPATVVEVVATRFLDDDVAKTLVRYIWKCKADPRVAVRAVDARGKERFRYDAAGAWTLHPEQPVTRIVPVGLRRSIRRIPDLSA